MRRLVLFLEAFGGLLLFAMMAVTFFDVLGRYVVGRPFPGSTEIIQVLLAISVACILPSVTWHGAHISVGLFESSSASPTRLERARRVGVALVGALTLAMLAWLLWRYALETGRNRDVIGYLQLPVAPMVHVISAFCGISSLVFCRVALSSARGHSS